MYWTLELASKLEDAPWPATKEELIDYALRSGAPQEVIENLREIEDEGEIYESIEDLWPDYPTKDDFFFHEKLQSIGQRLQNTKGSGPIWTDPVLNHRCYFTLCIGAVHGHH